MTEQITYSPREGEHCMNIVIDEEFRRLLAPLSPEELSQLETNIVQHGCRDPLVVWGDILVDGHNRHGICTKHSIPFQTTPLSVATREQVMLWIEENQLGRRNLSDDQRSAIAFRVMQRRSEIAKRERASKAGEAGGWSRPKTSLLDTVSNKLAGDMPQPNKPSTRDAVAAEANVPVRKLRGISEIAKAKPEVVEQIVKGSVTIAEAKREIRKEAHAEKVEAVKAKPTESPKGPFQLVLADPPWRYAHQPTPNREVENHYPTATLDEIIAHSPNTDQDAVLFLWATAPLLHEGLTVLKAWGFEYKTHAVWDKGKVGMGYWFRGQHELLLVGVKGQFSPTPEPARRSSVFAEPRKAHSRKPDCVYEWIEYAFPGITKLEMYCRDPREGWASWGNEVCA